MLRRDSVCDLAGLFEIASEDERALACQGGLDDRAPGHSLQEPPDAGFNFVEIPGIG